MAIVRCNHCERPIDLDTDSEVIWVNAEAYHWQCAVDLGNEIYHMFPDNFEDAKGQKLRWVR